MKIDTLQTLLNDTKITALSFKSHTKASEYYVEVIFDYTKTDTWKVWIPYVYRRAGLEIESEGDLAKHLIGLYPKLDIKQRSAWYKKEMNDWNKSHSDKTVTKPYFDAMLTSNWSCRKCTDKITKSSNNARRIQEIKEMGYLMASNTSLFCTKCNSNTTHDILIPIEKATPTGYETWSPALKKRIMKVLDFTDIYENKSVSKSAHMIPDHKFSEIRWDENTKEENPDSMTDQEIKNKFQLLTNQRNLQKREVCRICYQTGIRAFPFGIKYYYEGSENWPKDVSKRGKLAEIGCVGCGWYSFEEWRISLNKKLNTTK